MKKTCVVGWPVEQSRSPLIHTYWLEKHGIDGVYGKVAVRPSELGRFLDGLIASGYVGCNITIPHKERAFELVAVADEATERLGVVNTIYVEDGKLLGTSTDGEGFIRSVRAGAPSTRIADGRIAVLGAGGAAAALVGALLDAGAAEVVVANRTVDRALALRKRFGARVTVIDWGKRNDQLVECALLVNSTSLGMKDQEPLTIRLDRLPTTATVADIVYSPLETELLKQARMRGNVVIDGLGMLLHQAVRGFELWFGVRPNVTPELREIVASDIESRRRRP